MENFNKASVDVLFTNDYGYFKFLKGNRDLNNGKIKRITESVSNGLNLFRYCPILINKDGYVIDGQHRFVVCKQMKLPVFYIIVPDFTLRQIAEMNQNASKWKDRDFMNCYIDTGNENYKVLADFIETYGINIGIAVSLLSEGKVKGVRMIDVMRDGLFKATHLKHAKHFMGKAISLKDYCESYLSRNFLQAVEVLVESKDFSLEEFIDKLNTHGLRIDNRQSYKEYLTHIEDLFNYRNSKRKRIY